MLSDYAGHIIYSPCLSEKRNKKNAGDSPLVRIYSKFFFMARNNKEKFLCYARLSKRTNYNKYKKVTQLTPLAKM